MTAYYNEIDPKAAAWLRELIKQSHIAPGDVDERSISDVKPDDLFKYDQCHFFAGIGVWSYALRKSGWPDDRPVWTGSCPCQPFSSAGKRKGTSDERHLWPHWFHLISQCRPSDVFGEQVASKDGRAWFDTVQADMEALGFAIGAADLCAAGVGAPHIRQRLWFYGRSGASGHIADVKWREYDQPESVADASDDRPQGRLPGWQDTQRQMVNGSAGRDSATQRMVYTDDTGRSEGCEGSEAARQGRAALAANGTQRMADDQLQQRQGGATSDNEARGRDEEPATLAGLGGTQRMGDSDCGTIWRNGGASDGAETSGGDKPDCDNAFAPNRTQRMADAEHEQHERCLSRPEQGSSTQSSGQTVKLAGLCTDNTTYPTNGFWRDADWLGCRDGKFRPVEPGTSPLVDGAAARVGRLRGYGNGIVAQVAQTFIEATQGW